MSELSREMLARGVTDLIYAVGFSPTFVPADDRTKAAAVDYAGTLRLIAAAEAAKLPGRFVLVSSLGVNATTQSAQLLDGSLGGVLGQKALAEAALRRSALDWCIVRPGLLQKEVTQGGVLLGPEDRWTATRRDREGLGGPVKAPTLSRVERRRLRGHARAGRRVCVAALSGDARTFRGASSRWWRGPTPLIRVGMVARSASWVPSRSL